MLFSLPPLTHLSLASKLGISWCSGAHYCHGSSQPHLGLITRLWPYSQINPSPTWFRSTVSWPVSESLLGVLNGSLVPVNGTLLCSRQNLLYLRSLSLGLGSHSLISAWWLVPCSLLTDFHNAGACLDLWLLSPSDIPYINLLGYRITPCWVSLTLDATLDCHLSSLVKPLLNFDLSLSLVKAFHNSVGKHSSATVLPPALVVSESVDLFHEALSAFLS